MAEEKGGSAADEYRALIQRRAAVRAEELVEIPEWGKAGKPLPVLVVELSVRERAQLMQPMVDAGGRKDVARFYVDLMILSARHPKTRGLIFSEADREWLLESAGGGTELVVEVAMRVSKLSKEDIGNEKKD